MAKQGLNRIILIGNGFDLAHGLKTRYSDFMNKFWENQIIEANEFEKWKGENGNFVFENNFFKLKTDTYKKYTESDIADLKQDISYYKNNFLERIEKARVITNWVDLEELYYRELLNCLRIEKGNNDAFVVSPIKKLNEDFDSIRANFEDYLIKNIVGEITGDKYKDEINKHIWKELKDGKHAEDDFLGKILFLNFNYTATEKLYTKKKRMYIDAEIDDTKNEVIHIHGVVQQAGIKDDDNPMIFGYGDELAVDFKDIENTNRNEFLENAKSIKYLETDNYDRLLDFIKKGDYEVFIFGHSCGLSDRTLLNTIFENEHCKKIRPFYHQESIGKDNFREMTKNISRNFTREKDAKSDLRDKVEKKRKCLPFYYEDKIKADLKKFLQEEFVEIDVNGIEYPLIENEDKKQKINKFSIGKYQVTQAFYMQIMGCNNPSNFQKDGAKKPVEQVSWFDCVEFCNKLSEKYGLRKYYNINGTNVTFDSDPEGFRLPTENEWEYAARHCRKDNVETTEYAGTNDGEELKNYAWYNENSDYTTHEVGTTKNASELAIHDMSGNVWEWCEDWYDADRANRVLRGGSWDDRAGDCAVSCRLYDLPGLRFSVGFRLVLPQ